MSLNKYDPQTKTLTPIAGGFDVAGIINDIGDLSDLQTTTKSSLVAAVNEVNTNKVDKVEGKGLSTNDYSDTEKGKVTDNTSDIADIASTIAKNGAHNHLPYDITTIKANNTAGTWSGNVFTPTAAPNLTFTLNSNGSVTINGTNGSSNTSLFLIGTSFDYTHAKDYISAGDYIVSGNIDGYITNDSTFVTLNGYYSNNTDAYYGSDAQNSSKRLVTIPSDSKGCVRVGVLANKTVNNITVYPMIRLASDTNPEFTPYAMTNRELTDVLESVTLRKYTIPKNATTTITVLNTGFGFINATNNNGEIFYHSGTTITVMGGNLSTFLTISKPNGTTLQITSNVSWSVSLWLLI